MKIIHLLAFAALAFVITPACTTTSGTADPAVGSQFLRTGTSVAAYEGLKNNPRYTVGAAAMVKAIDVALTGQFVINEQTITAFVQQLAVTNHLDPAEALFLSGIARTAYQAYAAKYHVTTGVLITDPNARMYVQAFRDGLADALSMLGSAVPIT